MALVTTANESIQNPEKVGNGMKSIALNFAGMKANAKDGSLEMNKTAKSLQNIAGIDVMKNHKTGELKDMVTILDELHSKWGSLTDAQQKGLSEAIAGKHQSAIFQSLMGNYSTFQKMRSEFAQGVQFGSAERENEQYVNSLAGKLNTLKTTWLDTFTTVFNSDSMYSFLDVINKVSEGINKVTHSLADMKMIGPAIGGMIGGFKGLKKHFHDLEIKKEENQLKNLVQSMKGENPEEGTTGGVVSEGKSGKILQGLRNNIGKVKEGFKSMGASAVGAFREAGGGAKGLGASLKNIGQNIKDVGGAGFGKLKEGAKGLKDGAKAKVSSLGSSIAGGAIAMGKMARQGVALGLVFEGIARTIKFASDYANRFEIRHDKGLDRQQTLQQDISDLQYQKEGISAISKEYDTLYKKTNKSAEETKRFAELNNQIAEIAPDLKIGTDKDGNAILSMNGDTKTLIGSLDRAIERKNSLLDSNTDTLARNASHMGEDVMKDYTSTANKLESARDKFNKGYESILNNRITGGVYNTNRLEKLSDEYDNLSMKAQEYHEQLVLLNSEMSRSAINKLNTDDRYKEYQGATDRVKNQINALSSEHINWSNIQGSIDKAQAMKMFNGLAEGANKSGKDIQSLNQEIADMQTNFNASGDIERYNRDMDSVVKKIQEATGAKEEFIRKSLEMPRYDMDLEIENMSRYLGSKGFQYTDLTSANENIRKQAEQARAEYEQILGTFDGITQDDLTKEFVLKFIAEEENMPDDLRDLANKFLSDGTLSNSEKTALMKIGFEYSNGNTEGAEALIAEEKAKFEGEHPEPWKPNINIDWSSVKNKVIEGVKGFGKFVVDTLNEIFGGFGELIHFPFEIFDKIFGGHGSKGKGNKEEFEFDILPKINLPSPSELWNKVKEFFKNAFKGNKTETKTDMEAKVGVNPTVDFNIGEFINNIKTKYNELKKKAKTWINSKVEEIKAKFNIIPEFPSIDIGSHINNAIQGAKEYIKGFFSGQVEQIKWLISLIPDIKVPSWSEVVSWIKEKTGIGENKDTGTTNVTHTYKATPKYEKPDILGMWNKFWGSIKVPTKEIIAGFTFVAKYLPTTGVVGAVNKAFTSFFKPTEADKTKKLEKDISNSVGKNPTTNVKVKADTGEATKKITSLTKKLTSLNKKTYHISIIAHTSHAYNKVKAFLSKIKGISKKTFHMSVVAHTSHAYAKIQALLRTINKWRGKTFHASLVAHTSHAYSKVSALIRKAHQWNGHTFHASFVAHTAHAYAKVSSLVARASSWSGRTFHASMTVTKTVKEKTQKVGPRTMSAPTRRTMSTPAPVSADTPMLLADTPTVETNDVQPRAMARTMSVPNASDLKSFVAMATNNNLARSVGNSLKSIEQKIMNTIHGIQSKTISLAQAVEKGTLVTLTPISNTVKDILDALKFDINRLKELENAIKKVANNIDYLDKKMEHTTGSTRIGLLQQQNDLLVERLKLNEKLIAQKKKERDTYKSALLKKGLRFTKEGNISNYDETMLKYKREIEKLDEASEKAGEKNSDKVSKRNEKRKKELEETIQLMEKFFELVFNDIPELDGLKADDSNKYQDNLLEIRKIEHEKWVVGIESYWKDINKEVQKLSNNLDLIDAKMQHAFGKDKLDLMDAQIDNLKNSQNAYKNNLQELKAVQNELKQKLEGYGFKFNSNDEIENFTRTMNTLKNSSQEFDTIQKLVEGYFNVYLEEIPKVEKELIGLQNKIKDVHKEQLTATKEVEDKIIEMYKKEIEEKKKAIDEGLKARLDAIDKEKKAYDRMRESQKYDNDFNKQADKVKDLEKQIEYARKDTTLLGQKRLKDLMKQLETEKESLEKITQDRIDTQVNNSVTDEKDRLQENADKEKEDLDKKYTDKELLEMAQNAIKNGIFVGIDGEVKALKEAIVDYVNEWGEGLSATGSLIKAELITKLQEANRIAQKYGETLNNLGVSDYDDNKVYTSSSYQVGLNSAKPSINYNAPLVNVEGDVTDNNIDNIRRIAEEVVINNNNRIIDNI